MNKTLPFVLVSQDTIDLNREKLKTLDNYCEEEESDELLIVSKDKLYYKNYTGTNEPIALNSLTKVFAGTAIGLLLDEGLITSLKTPISFYYPIIKDTAKGNITIWNILTHTSGLKTLGHDNELSNSPNIVEYVLSLELEDAPGTVCKYNNEAVALISGIVKKVSGDSLEDYLTKKLFNYLDITKWDWLKDKHQNPLPYAGLSLTGLDLAKFAYLFLNKGIWENKRILSEDWIEKSTHPTQELDRNWGYLWLTAHQKDNYIGFGMSGFEGKYLFVSPEKRFIAIRLVHRKIGKQTPDAPNFFKYAIDLITDN